MTIQPAVTVNGLSDAVRVGDAADIEVGVALATDVSILADWWVVAVTPFGWHQYDVTTGGWGPTTIDRLQPAYRGALFSFLVPCPVLRCNTANLAAGTYTFYFGVDTGPNGTLDLDALYLGSVNVVIRDGVGVEWGEK